MATNEESCHENANFAIICSFILRFGEECGVTTSIPALQRMLEDSKSVDEDLKEIHIKLLRKSRKWFTKEKWEKALVKFCHEYSNVDAWEIERFGYKKAKLSVKLELLKRLLELQFDSNAKFKSEVNKKDAASLRVLPIGRDINGHMYWYQIDRDCNMRLYRQDVEDENLWELLCSTKEDLERLLRKLDFKSESTEEFKHEYDDTGIVADVKTEKEDIDERSCIESKEQINSGTSLLNAEAKLEQKNIPEHLDNSFKFDYDKKDIQNLSFGSTSTVALCNVDKDVNSSTGCIDVKSGISKVANVNDQNSQIHTELTLKKCVVSIKNELDKVEASALTCTSNFAISSSSSERNSEIPFVKENLKNSDCTVEIIKKNMEAYPECSKPYKLHSKKGDDLNSALKNDKNSSKTKKENRNKLPSERTVNKSKSPLTLPIFDTASKPPDAHLFKKSSLTIHPEPQNLQNKKTFSEKIDMPSYTNVLLEEQSVEKNNESKIGQCNKNMELTKNKSLCEEIPMDLSTTGRYREVKKEPNTLVIAEVVTITNDQCVSLKCKKEDSAINNPQESKIFKSKSEILCSSHPLEVQPLPKSIGNRTISPKVTDKLSQSNQNSVPVLKNILAVNESVEQNRQSVICEVKNSKLISTLAENIPADCSTTAGRISCDQQDITAGKQCTQMPLSEKNAVIKSLKIDNDPSKEKPLSVTHNFICKPNDTKSADKPGSSCLDVEDLHIKECDKIQDKSYNFNKNKTDETVAIGSIELKPSDALVDHHEKHLFAKNADKLSIPQTAHKNSSSKEFGILKHENVLLEKSKSEDDIINGSKLNDEKLRTPILMVPKAIHCIEKEIQESLPSENCPRSLLVSTETTSQTLTTNIPKKEKYHSEGKKFDQSNRCKKSEDPKSSKISDSCSLSIEQKDSSGGEESSKLKISKIDLNITSESRENDDSLKKGYLQSDNVLTNLNKEKVDHAKEGDEIKINTCSNVEEMNEHERIVCFDGSKTSEMKHNLKILGKSGDLDDKNNCESKFAKMKMKNVEEARNLSISLSKVSETNTDSERCHLKESIGFLSDSQMQHTGKVITSPLKEVKCSKDTAVPAVDTEINDVNKIETKCEESNAILKRSKQSGVADVDNETKCLRSSRRRKSRNLQKDKGSIYNNEISFETDNHCESGSKCNKINLSGETYKELSEKYTISFNKFNLQLNEDSKKYFPFGSCVLNNICFETKVVYKLNKFIVNNKSFKAKIANSIKNLEAVINVESDHEDVSKNENCVSSGKGKKRGRLKGKRLATSRKPKQNVANTPNSKDNVILESTEIVEVSPSRKTRAQNSTEKNVFSLPEGILEIIGNEEKSNAKMGIKRRAKPKEEIMCVSPTMQNSDNDSTPVKRSKRIQAQNIKKMSQLAEEMEKEQRRLEKLAKENAANAKIKQKEVTPVEVKILPQVSQKSTIKIKKKENNEPPEVEIKTASRSSRNRSRNLSKMTIMYEDDSKDSIYKASKESERSKKKRNGRCGKRRKYKPWDISDESDTSSEEFEIEEEEEEEQEERLVFNTNEDEFACEEIDEDAEPIIIRRARTAKKAKSSGESESENEAPVVDDKPCSRCEKYDQPEWILLCDKCDNGYHTKCLAPPLIIIPDGDWYCPPCEHKFLYECLLKELHKLDQLLKQKEREELRKQRLAYVGISLDNVLKPEKKEKVEDESFEEDESDESYEDERLCSKRSSRARRTVNYQFKEFDELIRSAIEGEMGFKPPEENEDETNEDSDTDVVVPRRKKKKNRRLNDLDFTEDDDSGDEYKGSSFSDTEVTPSANSEDSQVDSGSSASWKEQKNKHPKKKRDRSKKKHKISDESDENSDYRPTTRRAAQKNISYRELSSDDEWEANKSSKAGNQKRKQSESSTENSDQSFHRSKSKKKARTVHKWVGSDTESESEKSMSDSGSESSETSAQSSEKWKVKKNDDSQGIKININKKVLESDSDSSSKQVQPKKKNISRIVDSDEEESEDVDKKASDEETSSKSEEDSNSNKPIAVPDEGKVPSEFVSNKNMSCTLSTEVPLEPVKVEKKDVSSSDLPEDCHSNVSPVEKVLEPVQNPMDDTKPQNVLLVKKGSDYKMYDSSVSESFSNDGIETADSSALQELERRADTLCESDSEIDPRLSKYSGEQFLCKEGNFEKESEYRPAKGSQNFIYSATEEKSFPIPYPGLTSLQDYTSRPSPLKPSLVETYPNSTSPSKLTPLDSYSEASSPKGFISLDSCSPSKKKKNFVNPETESKSRPMPLTTENFQGEIRFAQEQYPPFERTSLLSPALCPSPLATFVRSPSSREEASPPRMYSQYAEPYSAQRSPEYYHSQQYFSGDDGASRPNFPPTFPASDQPAPYQFPGNPGQQSNGGFMIDTLLRSRNQEGTEDELTGVSDIVSYITQG